MATLLSTLFGQYYIFLFRLEKTHNKLHYKFAVTLRLFVRMMHLKTVKMHPMPNLVITAL